MRAIIFLTRRPKSLFLRFLQTLLSPTEYDIYVCIDDNTYLAPLPQGLKRIQIDNSLCKWQGYYEATLTIGANGKPLAWDKALWFLCTQEHPQYQQAWLIEDDVFLPSLEALKNLDRKYPTADLLSAEHEINSTGATHWHWKTAVGKIPLPWAKSMVCGVRVSSALLEKVGKYVKEKRHLMFIEYMFNTLAMQNNLEIQTPVEMKGIVWRYDWNETNVNDKLCLYHPVKDLEKQVRLRQNLFRS